MTLYPKKSPYLWQTGYARGKGQVSEKTVYDTTSEKESQFKKPYFFKSHPASERFYAPQLPYFEGIGGWVFPTPSITGSQISPHSPLTGGWETFCSFANVSTTAYYLKTKFDSLGSFTLIYYDSTYTNIYCFKTTNQGKTWAFIGGNTSVQPWDAMVTTIEANSIICISSVFNIFLEYYNVVYASISIDGGVTWTGADTTKDSYTPPGATFTPGSNYRFLYLFGGSTFLRDTATTTNNDLGFVDTGYSRLLRKVGDISYVTVEYASAFYFVKMSFPWTVLKYKICDQTIGGEYKYSYTENAVFEIDGGTFLLLQVLHGSKISSTTLGTDWWVYIRCFKSTTGIDWTEEKVMEYNVKGTQRLSESIDLDKDDLNYYFCHPVAYLPATSESTYPLVLLTGKNQKGTSIWTTSESTIEHEFGGTDFFVSGGYYYFINRTLTSYDFLRKAV